MLDALERMKRRAIDLVPPALGMPRKQPTSCASPSAVTPEGDRRYRANRRQLSGNGAPSIFWAPASSSSTKVNSPA